MPKFFVGSILGLTLVATLRVNMPTKYVPVFIGSYILLTVWSRRFSVLMGRYESLYVVGALQSGLGLLVGTTGPLATTLLCKMQLDKNQIITTNSLLGFSHFSKIIISMMAGFAFSEHLLLLSAMADGAIIGSFVGAHIRQTIGSKAFGLILNLALTFLAIRMLLKVSWV